MPNALGDVVATSAGAEFSSIGAHDLIPSGLLEVPDGFGEQTCSDEVQKAGGDDKEDLEFACCAKSVKERTSVKSLE